MKKREKGFTLIELLVVVAIIGILAAVGVVAYSGYTAGAKKSASKSNQGAVVKYMAAELKKCSMGQDTVMKDASGTPKLTCGNTMTGALVVAATKTVLTPEFSNPYDTKDTAIADGATATAPVCSKANRGITNIGSVTDTTTKETTFYIHTCFDEASATETNVVSNNFLME